MSDGADDVALRRAEHKKLGLSQRELGELLGIAQVHMIPVWEQGEQGSA